MAEFLEKQTKRYCRKVKLTYPFGKHLRSEEEVNSEHTASLSFDEKWNFTERVKKIKQNTMEKAAALIKQYCPAAVENEDNDRLTIRVDALDRATFEKVQICIDDEESLDVPQKKAKLSELP